MKKSRLNPISDKRYAQMDEEYNTRLKLIARCGGKPSISKIAYATVKGEHRTLWFARCIGGLCEECHNPPDFTGLHPHEEVFRSRGGKLSLENSKMLCGKCHTSKHGGRIANG